MSSNIPNIPNSPAKPMGPKVLMILGTILVGIGILKASVIGYYNSDLPWLLPVLLGGALCPRHRKAVGREL